MQIALSAQVLNRAQATMRMLISMLSILMLGISVLSTTCAAHTHRLAPGAPPYTSPAPTLLMLSAERITEAAQDFADRRKQRLYRKRLAQGTIAAGVVVALAARIYAAQAPSYVVQQEVLKASTDIIHAAQAKIDASTGGSSQPGFLRRLFNGIIKKRDCNN